MPVNGSELIGDPFSTIFSPFTDLLGGLFWIIILCFVAAALYVKSRDMTTVSLFILSGSAMLSAGNIFVGNETMGFVFLVFAAMGFVGLILSILFMRK